MPKVGETYNFFDDGKVTPSRHYKAKVIRIVHRDEELFVDKYDYDKHGLVPTPIQEVHKKAVDDHRQSERFQVWNGSNTTPGSPWLYAEETDYFIGCEIPKYDDNIIWFARTVDGGWFSMDIQSSWQGGRLDVDNKIEIDWNEEDYK